MGSRSGMPRGLRRLHAAAGAWIAVAMVWLAVDREGAPALIATPYAPDVIIGVLGGVMLHRAVRLPLDRLAWALSGIGTLAWAVADGYYRVVYGKLGGPPVASIADVGYALMALAMTGAVVLFARGHLAARRVRVAAVADGVVVTLALAAIATFFVLPQVSPEGGASTLSEIVALAYPTADLLFLGVVVGGAAARGWEIDRPLAVLAFCIVTFTVADVLFLTTTPVPGDNRPHVWEGGWWFGFWLAAGITWQPHAVLLRVPRALAQVALPVGFAAGSLAILAVASAVEAPIQSVAFSVLALCAVVGRLLIALRENAAMLAALRTEAVTDALTGLGNRRGMVVALQEALQATAEGAERTLVLLDLDGFKGYNDTFGHVAGDALLVRLGASLRRAVAGRGAAYRMGGDEFCLLLDGGHAANVDVVAEALDHLHEHGSDYRLAASHGVVALGEETAAVEDALRVADRRMYRRKEAARRGRVSDGGEACDGGGLALRSGEHGRGSGPSPGLVAAG